MLLVILLVRAYLMPQRNSVYPIFANAAREWSAGTNVYDKNLPRAGLGGYRYAPIIAVGFVPFAAFPDAIGGVLWRVCNAAVFLAGLAVFLRTLFPGMASLKGGGMVVLTWLLLPLSVGSLNNSQPNSLMVGCVMLAAAATLRERWNLAALCLAVPVLVKVYPVSVVALFVLIQPRLGWRVVALVALGLLAPFAMQEPGFVMRSYHSWVEMVVKDNRHKIPMEDSYRDFHVLTRYADLPLDEDIYLGLQLAAAGLVAFVVLRGHWQNWSKARHLRAAFDLGCSWMILFGPATENCTYALLAPTMALAVWEALQEGAPSWKRCWAVATVSLFLGATVVAVTPYGKWVSFVLMPLGGLMVFGERLHNYGVAAERSSCYADSGSFPADHMAWSRIGIMG